MKKNKKGFVLAEAIVVGVFLIELLTILITNVLPLVGEYERSFNYDTINRKYDINLIRKMVLINNITLSVSSNGYSIYSPAEFCNIFSSQSYCTTLFSSKYLDVKSVVVSTYDTSNLKTATNLSRGLEEYVKYLPTNSNHDTKYDNYKRLIVEFNDKTYANIEVPYE